MMNLLGKIIDNKHFLTPGTFFACLLVAIALIAVPGCEKPENTTLKDPSTTAALVEPMAENTEGTVTETDEVIVVETTEEPTTEKVEEPVVEKKAEEPVVEKKAEEPVVEKKAEEPVAKKKAEEPVAESISVDKTFGQDVEFLKEHVETLVLEDESGQAKIAVVPAYQGRVMTSSAKGDNGDSFGWVNYKHIAAGEIVDHMNAFGGEERFWLGPEGGQFSIFFKPEAKFDMDQWQTPAAIDSETYKVIKAEKNRAEFQYETKLTNYSKTEFELKIDRAVEVLSAEKASESLGVEIKDISFVGYRTENRLTNTGKEAWSKDSGLLSIWLLGMYKHGPETIVVIPFNKGDEAELGQIVNDTYFGKVPADRLKVEEEVLYFLADGQKRTKIGLTPQRAKSVCGSYDPMRKTLTIVKYNKPGPEVTEYVNSMWKIQEKPFAGDTVNSYNDGPNEMGTTMGPFYELETSSPALALKPGETGEHISETYHFQGEEAALDPIAKKVLGVSLEQIKNGLK